MKRTISFKPLLASLVAMLVSVNVVPSETVNKYDFTVGGIYYKLQNDKTVAVTYKSVTYWSASNDDGVYQTSGYSGTVTIPASVSYNGVVYSVTTIGKYAFCDQNKNGDFFNNNLTSVNLPSTITKICNGAFEECSKLTNIAMPEGVKSIGDRAFFDCSSLSSITIPSSVEEIGSAAFAGCTNLASIPIPETVTTIGSYAFTGTPWYNNQPDGLLYIGDIAYKYKGTMSSNTSIKIRDGVKRIADDAFDGCTGMVSIEIPSSVTSIGGYAFYGCTGLVSIEIPGSVTTIGRHAFYQCTELTSINIPVSVRNIEEYAFGHCSKLNAIDIPESVVGIGREAFAGTGWYNSQADGLVYAGNIVYKYKGTMPANTEIVLNNFTTGIADYAFNGCTGLKSITLSSSVTFIGKAAFNGCTGLTTMVIPNSVTRIGDGAFSSCKGLTSVTIPSGVTSIGSSAFSYCSGLTSVTIPSGVTSIGNSAFYSCTRLTSISIPSSVTAIGERVFGYCNRLSSINVAAENTVYDSRDNCNAIIETATNTLIQACSNTIIPNTVTSIENYAFHACSLTSVIIPSSVTNIGDYAFLYCSSLTSVVIDNEEPFVFGNNAFYGISSDCVLTVPYSTKSAYIAAGWTTDVFNGGIVEAPLTKISLDDGQAYSVTSNYDLERITYSRTYKNTNWQAWYVPFDVTLTSDVLSQFSFAKFAGTYTEDDGTFFISVARMREGDVVKANTPYLVQAKTAGTEAQVLTLTDATLYAAQEKGFSMNSAEKTVTIQGIYNTKTATDEDHEWYAFGGGKYIKASVGQTLSPYRFYMTITEREDNPYASTPNPTEVKIKVLGEDETGVAPLSVSPEEEKTAVYDLSGRRIEKEKATKGIYIINGKKIFVR